MGFKEIKNMPIYLQIVKEVKQRIISGQLLPGEKIKSVRELALEFEVNPNTMQKALAELDRDNILYTERTSGRYVTKETSVIMEMCEQEARETVEKFANEMKNMGFKESDIIEAVENFFQDNCMKFEKIS